MAPLSERARPVLRPERFLLFRVETTARRRSIWASFGGSPTSDWNGPYRRRGEPTVRPRRWARRVSSRGGAIVHAFPTFSESYEPVLRKLAEMIGEKA